MTAKRTRYPVRFDCSHVRVFGASGHPVLGERVWCPDCLRIVTVTAMGHQSVRVAR
jgi:hypothetical protein